MKERRREVFVGQTAFLLPMGRVDTSASGFRSQEKEKKQNLLSSYRQKRGLKLKREKTPPFGLRVTTKPNKQRQGWNLHGCCIQVACDLRGWQVHTLTDHLLFSFQARLFITGNKQGVRGF